MSKNNVYGIIIFYWVFILVIFLFFPQNVFSQTQNITYFDENLNRTITLQGVMRVGAYMQFFTIEGTGSDTRMVIYVSTFQDINGTWSEWQHGMSSPSPYLSRRDLINFFELYSNKNIGTGYTNRMSNMTLLQVLSKAHLREHHTFWNRETTGFFVHYTTYFVPMDYIPIIPSTVLTDTVFVEGAGNLIYYLSNNVNDIEQIIFNLTERRINLNSVRWVLNNRELSPNVKSMMNRHNVNYSIMFDREGFVVNKRVGNNWYFFGYDL